MKICTLVCDYTAVINIAGQIVDKLGFTALNLSVAILSLLYCPMLYYLKDMHDYQAYEGEEPGVVMKDPPAKEFQTIALQVCTKLSEIVLLTFVLLQLGILKVTKK